METRSLIALILLMLTTYTSAQTSSTHPSPDWTNEAHWSGTAPGYDLKQSAVLAHESIVLPSIRVADGHTLTIEAGVSLRLTDELIIAHGGTVILHGNLVGLLAGQSLALEGGSLIISPEANLLWHGHLDAAAPGNYIQIDGEAQVLGDLHNAGILTGTGALEVSGQVDNSGSLFGCTLPSGQCCTETHCNPASAPMPITLLASQGTAQQGEVLLEWSTTNERASDYYTIERSIDGTLYRALGSVPGAGNSSWTIDYSYEDSEPLNGIAYYRLRQTSYDGGHQYSEPIAIYSSHVWSDELMRVFPNPVRGNRITVQWTKEIKAAQVALIDLNGITLQEWSIPSQGRGSRSRLQLPVQLPSGSYILRTTVDGELSRRILVKQ